MTNKEKIIQLLESDCSANRQLGCMLGHNEGMGNIEMFERINSMSFAVDVVIGNYKIDNIVGICWLKNAERVNIIRVNSSEILTTLTLSIGSYKSFRESKHEAIEVFMDYVINK